MGLSWLAPCTWLAVVLAHAWHWTIVYGVRLRIASTRRQRKRFPREPISARRSFSLTGTSDGDPIKGRDILRGTVHVRLTRVLLYTHLQ